MESPKIAIYSVNFGNYRNELSYGLDNIYFDSKIDYYFFTDNTNIKSNKWKVIYYGLLPRLDFINSTRLTSKYLKFKVPDILKKYDYVIWIDSKSFKFLKFRSQKILNLFKDDKSMYLIKHGGRLHSQEELIATLKMGLEHPNGVNFYNEIKNIKFNTILTDTTCIVYKNDDKNRYVLKNALDILLHKGIRRDQNVFQYALYKSNHENKIDYFNFIDLW